MGIDIIGITKSFGDNLVLDDVNLHIEDHEFVSLIGPSGVGKTTLLKLLANLEEPDSGIIRFSEKTDKKRPVIMVFQDFSLFPHMTVSDNIGYGLKVRHVKKNERRKKIMRMLEWFDISDKANDYPLRLSAGQKQRVAIARALIVEPMVILLDEPFANLDKNLKSDTAEFIRKTQQSFGITTIMVSHDQEEAFGVSDRIAVLISGKLKQFASPETVMAQPVDDETARFLVLPNRMTFTS